MLTPAISALTQTVPGPLWSSKPISTARQLKALQGPGVMRLSIMPSLNSEVVMLTRGSIGLDTMSHLLRFGLDCFLRPAACKGLHASAVLLCKGVVLWGAMRCDSVLVMSWWKLACRILTCRREARRRVFLISGAVRAAAAHDFMKCHPVPAKRSDHPVT